MHTLNAYQQSNVNHDRGSAETCRNIADIDVCNASQCFTLGRQLIDSRGTR